MRRKSVLLIFFLIIVIFSGLSPYVVKSPVFATIYIDPVKITASPGDTFTVDVKIVDVNDLYTFGFYIKWVGPILNVTTITEGDFLDGGGVRNTFFTQQIFNVPDTQGRCDYAIIGCTMVGAFRGVDGSGTLATITFLVEADGESPIDLYGSSLLNSQIPGRSINHQMEDGYFNVEPPTFSVVPTSIIDPTILVNDTFSINVTVSDVIELSGFEFKLKYNSTLLNATELNIGPFLQPVQVHHKEINQTIGETRKIEGFLWVNATSTGQPVNGSGTIANVTFQVLNLGETVLDLYEVRIDDSLSKLIKDHTPPAIDGYFKNQVVGHEIAISKIKVFPTKISAGESVSINVTVTNGGMHDEVFDVTTYYDGDLIGTQTGISLEAGDRETVMFTWDTTGVSPGSYTIKAVASEVPDEVDTTNNIRTFVGKVTIEEAAGPDIFLYFVGAGIGLAVVAILVLVYFVRIRRR